ncbi:cholesterol oxidase [Rhodococcus rhodochrous J3]|uniref:Cholesterol oxidase n=2 Tax=Rhodococcus rhodochrous TaxID=1829 RepID=A0AA47AAF8_RHORH|nr:MULTISPECIES: GMC oxidoreductase [Rhodococcus]MCB8910990.1 GMC family oxidoreductase N-terminal domain-containing protein [Rhodococcus rhodochrous]MDC3725903.1 GMC family oxidoreductase [Rhodococcus sp. Rp3]MDO1484327.1 GMC family oxidoreductase [Rhodococcus rhodochrous]TWH38515.1 cholesterol oxidase [Rhodococcus rhodochrous J38]UZF45606.1 GMC family oxidoreductase N-terminal domain-containing protein [Rhodococcus rhodochrous]
MQHVTRRSFLTGAAAAAGLALTGTAGAHAAPGIPARVNNVPLTHEEHRVVVIGTGFGGGVTALRLARAGVRVHMLERGIRWPTGPNANTFPRVDNPDKRFLWHRSNPEVFGRHLAFEPYTGLVEACVGENMTALCAAGVGGGSLVYQGMTLQPEEAVFNANFPNELDWTRMDRVHYPRVAQMLRLAVAPDELVDSPNYATSRIFADRVRKAGLPIDKIPMPIDWNYALAELRGEMAPAYTDGSGAMGVNNGGKHSVDVTYIAEAEATGLVTVATQHEVTDIERRKDGRWTVHVDHIDTSGAVVENKILTTDALVLSAGTMNTTRLLMKAAAKDLISDLPDGVGRGWGSNADRIYLWTNLEEEFGAVQGGPVVYGSKNWDDPNSAYTVVQASIPGFYGIDMRSTVLVGYGVSAGRGHFVYDAARDDAVLRWPHEGDSVLQTSHIDPTVRRIAGERSILTDTNSIVPSTWHPLGGASMGTVCDLEGRVFGQRGLYVLDGALMPGNTAACNPSMTIAAVVERALDDIVVRDVGTVF